MIRRKLVAEISSELALFDGHIGGLGGIFRLISG